jgi:hypothetical protein
MTWHCWRSLRLRTAGEGGSGPSTAVGPLGPQADIDLDPLIGGVSDPSDDPRKVPSGSNRSGHTSRRAVTAAGNVGSCLFHGLTGVGWSAVPGGDWGLPARVVEAG